MNFDQIEPKLSVKTLETIKSLHFNVMTPVQTATIPLFLKNKDVCVEATTGSGKTIAFGIPIFEILSKYILNLKLHDIGCLVISPTR
jgi:ATP-dependent RNA helicase DDX55/SPB4